MFVAVLQFGEKHRCGPLVLPLAALTFRSLVQAAWGANASAYRSLHFHIKRPVCVHAYLAREQGGTRNAPVA